ncbi:MAG TPA: aspartate--tRNA ligase [Treponema sp.]|uniref:Aspartate--tRNA(Asp/Asn) ligase n=2 Tax=Treponemataceae TaxID=2845253 RepID=SYDND_TREDE|nr:RecName: Full=Aspartate--tRNA(Asp/Asn) ligase; AltName: Full=Aspartyl-tRNA synthetase; Short=AspRS; AltName: Full=Non-discriminating aspartyl-tRNA synthetase; Short=ND-AspRS [Treponema denticola ATCC 35405]AAS12104.1 aspartyl-tRNA synthetase [Treponema denticola ATCC 35405]HCY94912.1 aspartate--tRNA ligase [Treponema sp.]
MEKMQRTVTCGGLNKDFAGKTVVLNGWIHRKRDHGGITFLNLRDRYGLTQVVVDDDASEDLKALAVSLKQEFCIAVEGLVRPRPDSMINKEMATGEIEVKALKIEVLSKSEVLPFQIDEKTNANEDLRLKYRYLDLRSKAMQEHIMLRSKFTFAVREFLTSKDFLEIETPTFIKSTPEGARDYLVPSRLYPGKFYALPQSPQIYKQILMVSGFDKYFQIARCYRDEDARGDRQPEFTQIDLEMSFASREDVLSLTEGMMQYAFKKSINVDLPKTFERISYDEAIDIYGTDKPDLRFEMKMQDAAFMAEIGNFAVFKDAVSLGGAVKALVVKGQAEAYSRKKIEELEAAAKIYKAKGLAWIKVTEGGAKLEGGVSKFFEGKEAEICSKLGAEKGDLILFVADKYKIACTALGAVRSKLGKDLGLLNPAEFKFAWIVDFPLFEWNEEENKWDPAHHMFSAPQEKYIATMEENPEPVKGDLYDLVLNGYEVASGSIRIHNPELQKRIFKIVGFDESEAEKKFGFLTEAFKYGAPPHGGIAPGLDRIVMIMAGETSIKEVIAFPKNSFAVSPMDDSPSEVDQKQLDELHLVIKE